MHSGMDDPKGPGFPIQKSIDQSLFASSLWLIAGYNVFHRLSTPRHPPYALNNLIIPTLDRHLRAALGRPIRREQLTQRPTCDHRGAIQRLTSTSELQLLGAHVSMYHL